MLLSIKVLVEKTNKWGLYHEVFVKILVSQPQFPYKGVPYKNSKKNFNKSLKGNYLSGYILV